MTETSNLRKKSAAEPVPSAIGVPHPEKPLVYASSAIHDRRRRILKETRHMIAEHGIEGFTVRELSRRAGVAQSTLYNAFQNKDRIIAIAIRETRDNFFRHIEFRTDPLTLDGILDRVIASSRRNLQIKNYTRAVMSIYYSPQAHPDIWRAIQQLATKNRVAWLTALRKSGQLHDWVNIEDYAHMDANLEHATIYDWCQGRLSDEALPRRAVDGVLLHAIAATKGKTHARARALRAAMHKSGRLPNYPKPLVAL